MDKDVAQIYIFRTTFQLDKTQPLYSYWKNQIEDYIVCKDTTRKSDNIYFHIEFFPRRF